MFSDDAETQQAVTSNEDQEEAADSVEVESAETLDEEIEIEPGVLAVDLVQKNAPKDEVEEVELAAATVSEVVIVFSNRCWLKVMDANDQEVYQGIKLADETLTVSGEAPLTVKFGDSRAVASLHFNGEPVQNHTRKW